MQKQRSAKFITNTSGESCVAEGDRSCIVGDSRDVRSGRVVRYRRVVLMLNPLHSVLIFPTYLFVCQMCWNVHEHIV